MSQTKKLAERIGVVRRRKIETKAGGVSSEDGDANLKYLLVIDFESTCWKDKTGAPPPEVIEFPVVLLSLVTGKVVAEFHEYVMPVENPRLSPFCTQLTGIQQKQVDDGIPISTCLVLFSQWLKKVSEDAKFEVGVEATCLTWSDWDLTFCLDKECKRKQIRKPQVLSSWVDIRAVYREFYKRRPQGLNGALRELGLSFEGREHSGIEDARNTARLVWRMVQDGCPIKPSRLPTISGTLKPSSIGIPKPASSGIAKPSTIGIPKPSSIGIPKPSSIGIPKPSSSVIPKPSNTGIERPSTAKLSDKFASAPKQMKLSELKNNTSVNEKKTTISLANKSEKTPLICDIFKTPITRRTLETVSLPPEKGKNLQNDVYTPETKNARKQNVLFNFPKTPNNLRIPSKRPSPQGTPPFCQCGRRSRKHVAWRPGPNEGRTFFSCSLRSGTHKTGCKYFMWALDS